jgi:hypothetical protein
MNLGKYLFGIREEYFNKVSSEERKKQFFAYNLLAAMFYIMVSLAVIAGVCYGLVIFHNWVFALLTGVFLGGISFVLLLLVLFLNMTTNYQDLYSKMTDMKEVFQQYYNQDLTGLSDEQAQKLVQTYKMNLREENLFPDAPPFHFSGIFVSLIKIILILVLSCVIANGIEMLMFKNTLNQSMAEIKNSSILQTQNGGLKDSVDLMKDEVYVKWTQNMLQEPVDHPFLLIDCQSLLMINDILYLALGKWKTFLDVLFFALFLIPFMIVKKSRRYAGGVFLKEVSLSDISTSHMFYLLAQRKCQQVNHTLKNEYDYNHMMNKKT